MRIPVQTCLEAGPLRQKCIIKTNQSCNVGAALGRGLCLIHFAIGCGQANASDTAIQESIVVPLPSHIVNWGDGLP